MTNVVLVVENDPTDDVGRLGPWLVEAGLQLDIKRPHLGEELPEDLDGYVAFVVLGGEQSAFDDTPWFPRLESLMRKGVRHRVPTLGICLGGQLLAQAHGGRVERSEAGLEIGAKLVAKRDAAGNDPLFGPLPFAPDVVQYHYDEITQLPAGAVLMAASPRYPVQAFRIGDRAWGTQFHLETDTKMFAGWTGTEALIEGVDAIQEDMEEVWRPFAHRFAQLALGQLSESPTRENLPLL
ncbi:type 1 glutamine amidotransferase [Catelliglobosispora koreensis]|uniref:type 1 glutamine amidotransferase n=1 Tax=Catelliglobosispora koreensis TaxID=129052 RepID=UPI00058C2210|nr:type 1 glutamine amidotransferase [Catelliglobosispora koreensis]